MSLKPNMKSKKVFQLYQANQVPDEDQFDKEQTLAEKRKDAEIYDSDQSSSEEDDTQQTSDLPLR